jgi:hypothetical protein
MKAVAIKKGQGPETLAGFREMGTLRCDGCGEEFFIGLNDLHVDAQIAALQKFHDRLHRKTSQCERSTAIAIIAAQPIEKLSALNRGLNKWMNSLRATAIWYYKISFELALRNLIDLRGENPADFVYRSTAARLSSFLRVSTLDGEEEGSNGRVREFFRHVVSSDSAPTSTLRLPGWAANRGIGARLAARATGRPFPPVGGTLSGDLSAEQTDSIIRSAEARLTASLGDALLEANRDATIDTCLSTSSPLMRRGQLFEEAPSQQQPASTNGKSLAAREAGMSKAGPIAANVRRQVTTPFEEFAGGLFTEQLEKSHTHRVDTNGT